ncbi:MAG: S8 family peptidase, partial [Muribaculaceae bacterium]|nr:S8 family peptidase [Muribaculaceae bacterium]
NTICVGSFNTNNSWYDLDGVRRTYGSASGLSNFSSWGNLLDGRSLPHVCAPGAMVVSSYSGPYTAANFANESYFLTGKADFNGKTHYWAAQQGTSMATPYVTGVVALWLEANPDLTAAQVREVIAATAVNQGESAAWGAGKIHASNGLKKVISDYPGNSGIADIETGVERPMIVTAVDGSTFDVTVAGADAVEAALYSTTGAMVASASANGNNVTVSAPSATPGIYILRANNHTAKVTVR